MLSTFTAQPTVELKSRDKSKIESLLAYGDRLLVGFNTGALRVYRIQEPSPDSQESLAGESANPNKTTRSPAKLHLADCLRDEEKFSRRPIQQLAIIKEASILVSLSDGYVSFHDLQTFLLSERLEASKGATTFSVISNIVKDETTGIASILSRLAIAVKRKVLVWSWQDMELSGPPLELALPAAVKCLAWATGTKIMAGMDPGYALVNIESQEATEIHKAVTIGEAGGVAGSRFGAVNSSGMSYMGMGGWVPKPMATKVGDEQILLAKDVNTLFVDLNGKPIEKRQIPWATAPDVVGYSYPYLLSLSSSRGIVEIRNPDSLTLLHSISLPNATHIHVPQPNISLAHAGKGFLTANERCVWRMEAQDYSSQINELIGKEQFDEAISIISMLEDTLLKDRKNERLREVRILKAEHLFRKRQYAQSLELFSMALAPPAKVIGLYPRFIAGDLSMCHDEKGKMEPTLKHGEADVQTQSKQISDGVGSPRGNKRKNSSVDDSEVASVRTSIADRKESGWAATEVKELKYAINELCAFLAQARKELQKYISFDGTLKESALNCNVPAEGEVAPFEPMIQREHEKRNGKRQQGLLNTAVMVDTTLFRAYMFARPGLAGSLFRLDNFCDPDVVKQKLYETGRFMELIDFLHGKKRHYEALELLEKFGKGEKENDMEVDKALQGPRRTVAYLQQLPFELIELILNYGKWPIQQEPGLGMEVFLADTENAESLPRDRIIEFLVGIDESLAIQYIEHIITDLYDRTTEFHDCLIKLYINRLISPTQASLSKQDCLHLPAASLQSKLEEFLRNSKQYTRRSILSILPKNNTNFYESRAIVHSRLLQHRQALEIYVFDLKSPESAEAYCNAAFLSSDAGQSHDENVYTTLLSLYLEPPPPLHLHPPNLEAALSLLSRHGSRLPALSTMSFLPSTLPLEKLEEYFFGRMRSAASESREISIIKALSAVEKAGAEKSLLIGDQDENRDIPDPREPGKIGKGRNRRVVLSDDRVCAACHKRFGRAAIRMWPNGEVLHYGCGEPASRPLGTRFTSTSAASQ